MVAVAAAVAITDTTKDHTEEDKDTQEDKDSEDKDTEEEEEDSEEEVEEVHTATTVCELTLITFPKV